MVESGRRQDISAALLRGLRAGSNHAWAVLYDRLAPGIQRFAVSRLSGDPETAEDIAVETLALAARDIARFDAQRASLSAWIYGIARHRVQAELRRCQRRKSVPAWAQVSFEDLTELADSHDVGARTAARLDAQRRVEELTDLLSDSEVELLELSAVEELPGEEISRVVGRSEQATRALLKRAKQKARRAAIEGTLIVGGGRGGEKEGWRPNARLFVGSEDWLAGDAYGDDCQISPVSDEIAYHSQGPGDQAYWVLSCHIWKARTDGSDAMNLSEAAGLRGINQCPRWSPDGTMIAFVHWDEPGGETAGPGEVWAVKVDGSEARMVARKETAPVQGCAWYPHGLCLVRYPGDLAVAGALPGSADLWGRRVRLLLAAGDSMVWSPDGTRVACPRAKRGHIGGEPGYWRQLLLMEADGSRPRVLVEQFIADAQLDARRLVPSEINTAHLYDWRNDLLWWAGPLRPTWSPGGDKIAFLAALPFDPELMVGERQVDAWVYDLVTRRLTKVTNAPSKQYSLSWR